jgi:hypothetical protein
MSILIGFLKISCIKESFISNHEFVDPYISSMHEQHLIEERKKLNDAVFLRKINHFEIQNKLPRHLICLF